MLGFSCAGALRRPNSVSLGALRAFAAASASSTSEATSSHSSHQYGRRRPASGRPQLQSSEEVRILQKHKGSLDSREINTIAQAIETVEWRGQMNYSNLEKIVELLGQEASTLVTLSDRQLAVLLSAFGNVCDSAARSQRLVFLERALKSLLDSGVTLGPLSRGALLAARLDNGEAVNVVEEFKEWDAAGVSPDRFAFGQFARAYALQGNYVGVSEIINFVKADGLAVDGKLFEDLAYALGKQGRYAEAEQAVQKFSSQSDTSELRLRCAVATAAATKGEIDVVLQQLALIPSTAKIYLGDNNKLILNVLIELLEQGSKDGVDRLRPYLSLDNNTGTLTEKNNNQYVIATSRRFRAEGKLEQAFELYALVHPTNRSSATEDQFRGALMGVLFSDKSDNCIPLVEQAATLGIVEDPVLFLLSKFENLPHEKARIIFDALKDKIRDAVENKPALKRVVAKKVAYKLSSLSEEEQVIRLCDAITVLFSSSKGQTLDDLVDFQQLIFKIGANDVLLPIKALPKLKENHLRSEYGSAIVAQLLSARDRDVLASEKLDKLLQSGALTCLHLSRHTGHVSRLLLRPASNTEQDEAQLALSAKLIALEFPENVGWPTSYAAATLMKIVGNPAIKADRISKLIELLEREERVGLSVADVKMARETLIKSGQQAKIPFVERLLRRGMSMSRWRASSVESLEEELASLSTKDAKPGVLDALRETILQKIASQRPVDLTLAMKHLAQVSELNVGLDVRIQAAKLRSITMDQAVHEGRLDMAMVLFRDHKSRFNLQSLLHLVSMLHLEGRSSDIDEVVASIRASAATIKPHHLDELGYLLSSQPSDKLESVATFLHTQFNLEEKLVRRVVNKSVLQTIEGLIEKGNLREALAEAVAESNRSGYAFGQFELARAFIRRNEQSLLGDVFRLVEKFHERNAAYLDIAYALLEEGKVEAANKLLLVDGLWISQKKLAFFMKKAKDDKRSDVLRHFFTAFSKGEGVNTVLLNDLLAQLTQMYYQANDIEAIRSLEQECTRISFPLEVRLRKTFDSCLKKEAEAPKRETSV